MLRGAAAEAWGSANGRGGTVNGHPGHAHLCPCRGGAEPVRGGHRARLFDRTTRSIRITEEGAAFLAHVERILSEIEAARASVDDKVSKPKGKLKIAAPACLGRRYVAPALCEFVRAYPEIDVHVDLHDRQVNLQEDGYDVAIRTGVLSDSSLIAKRLAPDRHVIVGSPAYLARRGCPQRPQDLTRHDCLMLGENRQWSFNKDGVESAVRVAGPLRSNNGELLCRAAVEGIGLIRASELEVACEQNAGKLVQVLPDFEVSTNSALWALYPSAKHVLPRMRALLDFLANWFRDASHGGRAPAVPPIPAMADGVPAAPRAKVPLRAG